MNIFTPIKPLVFSVSAGLLWPFFTMANENTEHRHHQAHEHGHVELNIVLEKNVLQIMLQSPGINIVGFEHTPENEDERQRVLVAIEKLKQANNIFQTPAKAKCTLILAEVETELAGNDQAHQSDKTHDKEEHAEFLVNYSFNCDLPDALTSITVKLFELYPLIDEIDGQLVTETIQQGFELSASNTVIQL